MPPSVVGAPLIVDLDEAQSLSKAEVRDAGGESVRLLGRFFDYQTSDALQARRLVLALPPSSATGKRRRSSHSCNAKGDVIAVTGVTFGVTLGGLCAFLEGRGVPAERANVLRAIRAQLVPVAAALQSMRGADVPHLSRGLASCRVVAAQRSSIAEPTVKLDSKYGHGFTGIGATAAILVAFGVMMAVPNHARHFVQDDSLIKALRCAVASLESWKVSSIHMPQEHWDALAAEKRALRRAAASAQEAARFAASRGLLPAENLDLQLFWIKLGAFPSDTLVSEFTQASLLEQIRRHGVFKPRQDGAEKPSSAAEAVDVVPLSQIAESELLDPHRAHRERRGEGSVASSSWATLSSRCSSAFSHVSNDSLSELLGPLGDAAVK